MREVNLPDEYAGTLATGLWPADDFMPAQDRAARGRALAPPSVHWPSADARRAPFKSARRS
jgi:hypothetical protein